MKFTVEHLGIMSSDPAGLADWYCRTLGFKHLFTPEGSSTPVFIEDDNGVILEFFPSLPDLEVPDEYVRKMQHLSLSVEDFDEAVTELESRGVVFPEESFEIFQGGRVRFFRDPEGNWIHLIWRPRRPW